MGRALHRTIWARLPGKTIVAWSGNLWYTSVEENGTAGGRQFCRMREREMHAA